MTDPKTDRELIAEARERFGYAARLERVKLQDLIRDEVSGIVIGSGYYAMSIGTDGAREVADAVIEALTNAGRLIPEGAEMEEQYQVRWGDDGTTSPSSKERALDRASSTHGDIVEVRTSVSFTTPWREVQGDE